MNIRAVSWLLLTALIAVSALPVQEHEGAAANTRVDRHRRVTCDLVSHWVGDSACAANCLSMGKAGGKCNGNGICVCRKDRIKDLWDKRFG